MQEGRGAARVLRWRQACSDDCAPSREFGFGVSSFGAFFASVELILSGFVDGEVKAFWSYSCSLFCVNVLQFLFAGLVHQVRVRPTNAEPCFGFILCAFGLSEWILVHVDTMAQAIGFQFLLLFYMVCVRTSVGCATLLSGCCGSFVLLFSCSQAKLS